MGNTGGTVKLKPYTRIVIDGMDGSGKTTLTNQIMEWLGDRGYLVVGYN
jgi:thymidylate kinase